MYCSPIAMVGSTNTSNVVRCILAPLLRPDADAIPSTTDELVKMKMTTILTSFIIAFIRTRTVCG